jgi:hypothetical protein
MTDDAGDGRHGRPAATGFVWCTPAAATEERGFEWGGAVADDRTESKPTASAPRTGETDDDETDELTLDRTLVTTARGTGIDDEAVSLLAAFRQHRRRREARRRESGRE